MQPTSMQLHLSPPVRAPFVHIGRPRPRTLAKAGPCRALGKEDAGVVEPAGTRIARRRTQATSVSSAAKGLQTNPVEEIQIIKRPEEPRDRDDYHVISEVAGSEFQQPLIDQVKGMLGSMGDGEISVSGYDTAWVALVPRLDGGEGPEFPASLRWILDNQLPDGSWGDAALFSAYDRIINTLGCVVALTKWSLGSENCRRGLSFVEENMWRLGDEDPEEMPIGFEIAFPSLLDTAKGLGIVFPYDHHALQSIYANRELKLKKY